MQQTAAKNRNAKQSIVIEEECFLHAHRDIKAQKRSMHMNEFLHMFGLDKGKENLIPGLIIKIPKFHCVV